MSARTSLPTETDAVIIGGGVMGLSTAYHLARAGVRVVLVERDSLGEGSTSRAAGGVRALFSDELNIRLGLHSLETFERFGAEFGQEIDLHQVGYLFLLEDEAHITGFADAVPLQNALGVESQMISPEEAKRLSPLVEVDGIRAALYSPRDGHCTPESVVAGYAGAARQHGAVIRTGCAATGLKVVDGAVVGVHTTHGEIATKGVVCTAGAWSKQIGEWAGVGLPVEPLRRQIVVTEPIPDLPPDTPFTIDFSTAFYFHGEGQGLLLGMPEREEHWGFDQARTDDWLGDLAEVMAHRLPTLGDVGLTGGWAGLYEMTPDHNAVLGRAGNVEGFFYATGFSGHGFLMGPAVGEVMADLWLGHTPFLDVSALSADRFAGAQVRPELNIV